MRKTKITFPSKSYQVTIEDRGINDNHILVNVRFKGMLRNELSFSSAYINDLVEALTEARDFIQTQKIDTNKDGEFTGYKFK